MFDLISYFEVIVDRVSVGVEGGEGAAASAGPGFFVDVYRTIDWLID